MKRKLLILVAILAILTLVMCSCSSPSKSNTDTSNPSDTETPSEDHEHSYGAWKTITPASCGVEGTRERSCECGYTETGVLSAKKHNFIKGTCTICKATSSTSSGNSGSQGSSGNSGSQGSSGTFTPDYTAAQKNTVGNISSSTFYATQGDWIYFCSDINKISKFKNGTSKFISVYTAPSGVVMNLNVAGDWIYFYVEGSNLSSSYIAKVRTDGSQFEKIVTSVNVHNMLVVKDTVYFNTFKSKYNDYAKEWGPLYSVSIHGGTTKQLQDGCVSSMCANDTHLFFLHKNESGSKTIYRMKLDGSNKVELRTRVNINYFVLADSKLYFLEIDKYGSEECTVSSINTNGGAYTSYAKTYHYSEWLLPVGNSIYYYGHPYSPTAFNEEFGIVEYDISSNKYKVIKETYITFSPYSKGILVLENYSDSGKLTSISLYNTETKSWKNITIK